MRIGKEGARRGRELSVTGLFIAEEKPFAAILGVGLALNAGDFLPAAFRAAHDAIGPAHLLDVDQALFVRRKPLMGFPDIHATILTNQAICVK